MIQLTGIKGKKKGKTYFFFTARRLEGFTADLFHWMPTAKELGYTAYFIRDTKNSFYKGSSNFNAISMAVRHLVKHEKGESIFIGASMGGYGAIRMSNMCKPSKVIAFSPTPNIVSNFDCLSNTTIHVCKDSDWDKVNGMTDIQNAGLFNGANILYHDQHKGISPHNVAGVLKERGVLIDAIS